jgi:hypothetical protein
MIIKSLLAVAITAATLNPTPAAEQGMPATSISSHQPASVESSTTRAEVGQTTSPVAPAGVFPVTRLYPGYLIVVINKSAWIVTGIKGQM